MGGGGARGLAGRDLHSSTFQLNVSAFCGIGGARGIVWGLFCGCLGGVRGCSGVYVVYFVSDTTQVELKSGRV